MPFRPLWLLYWVDLTKLIIDITCNTLIWNDAPIKSSYFIIIVFIAKDNNYKNAFLFHGIMVWNESQAALSDLLT